MKDSTLPGKQCLKPWQDQPQGPLWTSSPQCDYETITFPRGLTATHFPHPANEFALPSAWSLLFYLTKEVNIHSSSPHGASIRCLTLKEAGIVMLIFQEYVATSPKPHSSRVTRLGLRWCPREQSSWGWWWGWGSKLIFSRGSFYVAKIHFNPRRPRVYQGLLCPGHQGRGKGAVFPFYK